MNLKLAGLCIVLLGLIIWSRIIIMNTSEVLEVEPLQQKQALSQDLSSNITPPQLTTNGAVKSRPTVYSPKHSNVVAQAHTEKKLPAQKQEVTKQDWIEQNSSITEQYEIIDLSHKHTPFTKIVKQLDPRDKWSAVMGTGSISVTNTDRGQISEFFIGKAKIEELWTRHIDFDSKTITVYDKFEH